MKKIKLTLDPQSIDAAIKELKAYQDWFVCKTKEFAAAIAAVGAKEAAHRFGPAMYDGDNDVIVEVKPLEKGNGWVISASGNAVYFLEFGAGVHHNPGEPYPNPRPPGIVNIGEYGTGKGKQDFWFYTASDGTTSHFTYGNPAVLGMWYASKEVEREYIKVAKEVFAND